MVKEKSVADKVNTFPSSAVIDVNFYIYIENKYAPHKKCYMQFMNKTKIDKAKILNEKKLLCFP